MAHSERAHAKLSASGAYIWLNCTMSPSLSEGVPRKSNKYADEGTRAHEYAQWRLAQRGIGKCDAVNEMNALFENNLGVYLDYVESLAKQTDLYAVEKRVSLARLWENDEQKPPEVMFGTSDFVALVPHTDTALGVVLHVVDLKFGAGVAVDPKDNSQGLYYALGTYLTLPENIMPPDAIRITIVQPRAQHPDGPIRHWDIATVDMLDWAYSVLKPTVELIAENDKTKLSIVEGKHCRWCPAASGNCPEKRKTKATLAKAAFVD
jgi:hypothetical protein